MPLTDAKLKSLKPKDKAYKVSDFEELYVLVSSTGSRLWRFKYRLNGKEGLLSLGHYVEEGVQDLSRDKLSDYLTTQFGSQVTDAKELGGIEKAIESYIGIQAHLY